MTRSHARLASILFATIAAATFAPGARAAQGFCITDRGNPAGFNFCADAFANAGGPGDPGGQGTTTVGSPGRSSLAS